MSVRYPKARSEYVVKHYRPGLMERVYEKRLAAGLVGKKQNIGWYGSTPLCENIGRVAQVRLYDPKKEVWGKVERVLIVDCAQPEARNGQMAGRLGLEVSFKMAEKYGFAWGEKYPNGEGKSKVLIVRWEDRTK